MFIRSADDKTVTIDAPAKINLFLEVLRKRPDGYHDINSVFQAVSLFDRLVFTRTDEPGVTIQVAGGYPVPTDGRNLVAVAYDRLRENYPISGGLNVSLEKRIPVAAGLGGGSSDAAAAIIAGNILFGLGLSRQELRQVSSKIGSDLPFFFTRGQALVRGRGDLVEEVELPTGYQVVLVNPGFELSTAASYALLKRNLTMSKKPFNLGACPRAEELVRSLQSSGNDFEEVHLQSYPELGRLRDWLLRSGASLVRMTGSGPTVFGIFHQAPDVLMGEDMAVKDWQWFTVSPVVWP